MIVSDTTQSRTFMPNPLLPDTRSEMAVPLLVGERVVGVLDLQSAQPGALTAENLPAFEALAGQLAIAIENAQLFRQTAQARAEVEAQVKRLARQGWEELLDGVKQAEHIGYTYEGGRLEPVAESVAEAPAAQVLATPIQLHGQPIGAIQVEAASDRAWSEAEAGLVESVARQVAQQAENLRLLAQAEGYRVEAEQASRRLTREGWQAYLETQADVIPGFVYDLSQVKPLTDGGNGDGHAASGLGGALKVRGETIGELAVDRAEGLDDQAAELVTAVAERLSAHIENLRLLEETQHRRFELEERGQELEASQRVTFAANETDDPDELLDLVVNLIRDQFDLYHAQVYVVDAEKQAARLRQSTGYAGRQLLEQGHAISLDQAGPLARAIREGQPVVIADVAKDKSWQPDPLLPHTRSELAIPLKTGQGVIGALDVHSRTPSRFTPRTVALFSAMAEQVAMNFESADLLIRTTQQAEALTRFTTQLRTAAEVAARLNAILDPQQLMNEVVDLLQSRFGLYHAHIYLLETPPSIPPGGGEAGGAHLVVRAGSGAVGQVLCERGHHIPLDAGKSVVARAARERETVLVEDTTLVSDFMPNPLLPQTRSEIAVPLVVGERVLGVLDVQDDQPGRFSESDLNVFGTLAGQVATALDNARLFEEQQETQQALRKSEAQQRLIFEASPTPTLVTQLDGTILYANPQVSRLFGMPLEEIISRGSPALYDDPADRKGFLEALEREGRVRNYEVRFKKGDGTPIWGLLSSEAITFAGKPALLNGIYDITERKQAEEAVRASQQMLQTVMDNVPQSIFWKDQDLAYLGCNREFAEDAGKEPEEIIGKTDYDMPWVEQAELYRADDSRVMSSGEPVLNYEEPQSTPDGSHIWLRTSKVPLRDAQGKVTAVLGIYEDITERKQAEQERERFTTQLSTAADVAAQIGAILDPDQLLNTVIPLLKERFGLYYVHFYTLDEAARQLALRAGYGEPGRIMLERGHSIPLDAERSLVARAARSKEIVLVNDVTQEPDFLPNPLLPETRSEVAVPAIAGGVVLGVFDVQHNVPDYFTKADLDVFATLTGQITTALQNAGLFEEIQRAAERLREVDRLKSEFLANMSHELRTPLNSILGYTEVMLMGINGELDPETLADVQAIYDNGRHLLRLINDILDLAKIEAGRMTLNLESLEVAPLFEEAKTSNAGLLVNKPVEMILEVEENLPSIQADRMRLSQILNNLVSNAVKFTEAGHITLRAFGEDGWVCLEVEDTGAGIKEADLETIFDQFHQGDSSHKKRAEGTGLGLAITRHLVHMHGGSISVRSQVGEGSAFSVRLPVESRAAEAGGVSGNGR
jgi:PAS domain S-box-containing protein